ncbi:nucleotidyltransferase domain-containing protein [Prosthecobacter sp.]|jgi:predicted nucleotidyltransferase|uniref:nucleotidyltransferase domain-containing protein n=1 Tax=Prosthecobacter sp. TaxID=1965333 RepID=UPI0037832B27
MISRKAIQQYCDAIAAAFKPRKIILFGSYAYGTPDEDSDVDVMVVMPKNRFRRDLGFKMRMKVPASFPVDVLVEPEDRLHARILDRESFILDITEKGRVMYEGVHA